MPGKRQCSLSSVFYLFKKIPRAIHWFQTGRGGAVVPPPCPLRPTPGLSLLLGDIFWLLGLGV